MESSGTGIIAPGPQLQRAITKTAAAVAANPSLTKTLLNHEKRHEFQFLEEQHPFYPYFIHKLQEAKAAAASGLAAPQKETTVRHSEPTNNVPPSKAPDSETRDLMSTVSDPHPDRFTLSLPSGISQVSQMELTLMTAAAQQSIQYGRKFEEGLLMSKNSAYNFVNTSDPKHSLYRAIVQAYDEVRRRLADEEVDNTLDSLENLTDATFVLRTCREVKDYRVQAEKRALAESFSEPKLLASLQWLPFTVVGSFSLRDLQIEGARHTSSQSNAKSIDIRTGTTVGVIPSRVAVESEFGVDPNTGEVVAYNAATRHTKASTVAAKFSADTDNQRKRAREDDSLADDDDIRRRFMV